MAKQTTSQKIAKAAWKNIKKFEQAMDNAAHLERAGALESFVKEWGHGEIDRAMDRLGEYKFSFKGGVPSFVGSISGATFEFDSALTGRKWVERL